MGLGAEVRKRIKEWIVLGSSQLSMFAALVGLQTCVCSVLLLLFFVKYNTNYCKFQIL